MLCARCGAAVPDGANVCGVCGQPVAAAPQKKKLNVKALVIGGVAVVAVVVLCLLLFGGSSYSGLVDDYLEYVYEDDLSNIEDMAPEAFWNYVQKEYKVTAETIENDPKLQAALKKDRAESDANMVKEYGSDWSRDWSVSCDHEVTSKDLGNMQKSIAEKYGLSVEEVREVHVKKEIDGDVKSDISYTSYYVAKIDGDWYLMSGGDFAVNNVVSEYTYANNGGSSYGDYDYDY